MNFFESVIAELTGVTPRLAAKLKGYAMERDTKNDPPPSKGTDEPWKEPGQVSQNPGEKISDKDLDAWKDAVDKNGN